MIQAAIKLRLQRFYIPAGQDYELHTINLHEIMNETQMIEHAPLPDLTGMQCYFSGVFIIKLKNK